MKNNFEQRRQARIERANKLAQKNEQVSDQAYNAARGIGQAIPMGQPILVGHHSEKRHRRDLERIDSNMRKSVEASKKAEHYRQKAQAIEDNGAIFSDDPKALEKLTAKLQQLTEKQEFMKAANRCLKKKDKEKFLKLPGATEQLWIDISTPVSVWDRGFPHYKLSNNNAEIRRIKQRIEQLKRIEEAPEIDFTVNGVQIFGNKEANRLQLSFDSIPSEEIRKALKSRGFRWSRHEKVWQRHLSNQALYAAKEVAALIAEPSKTDEP